MRTRGRLFIGVFNNEGRNVTPPQSLRIVHIRGRINMFKRQFYKCHSDIQVSIFRYFNSKFNIFPAVRYYEISKKYFYVTFIFVI